MQIGKKARKALAPQLPMHPWPSPLCTPATQRRGQGLCTPPRPVCNPPSQCPAGAPLAGQPHSPMPPAAQSSQLPPRQCSTAKPSMHQMSTPQGSASGRGSIGPRGGWGQLRSVCSLAPPPRAAPVMPCGSSMPTAPGA